MKKRCELCKSRARIYCDSDSASLCWSCDAKVHSANFLVARHSRSLLCQVCQSPTPWSASGEKIGPTTSSICGRCVVEDVSDDDDDDREERVEGNYDGESGTDGDDEYDGDEYGDELELEDSVDGNDNQVVPWSSTPPPPPASSSSSEEFSIGDQGGLLKRKRQKVLDLNSEDEIDSSSVNINHNTRSPPTPEPAIGDETTSFHSPTSSISESTVGKHKRIRHQTTTSGNGRSTSVIGTIKSTKTSELALNSSDSP